MTAERQFTPTRGARPKYQLLMELGRGGMGVVHLAMVRGPGGFVKLFVLKMLKAQLLGDERAHGMFTEEARISARLAHPNIVQVFEVTDFDGSPTIVMEYLDGQPLHVILGDESLPRGMYLHVITKLLAGLHAAHELRDYAGTPLDLVHRDVSPHNVFVLYDGQVKVLDFGIAKAAGSEVHTLTGELKGKIRYMAPEQLRGETIDRRADIFAVGVMLWEALAGRRLWDQIPEGDVMLSLLTDKVPRLPAELDVSPELREICEKALQAAPERRYSSAAELQRDLERQLPIGPEPCSDADLAGFMQERFATAREATDRLVEAHLKTAERGSEVSRSDATQIGAPSFEQPVSKQGRTNARRWIAALAGAVVAVMLAVPLLLRLGEGSQAPPVAAQPSASQPLACSQGLKACDGQCVSSDRPDFGCASAGCAACVVSNATARCNAQQACDIAVCYQDFDNCDGDPKNGCEANVRIDPDNCGGCGKKCAALPNAERGCGDVCTIWRCKSGYRDCNGLTGDGCELDVSQDAKNCGHCGASCRAGERCREGRCGR